MAVSLYDEALVTMFNSWINSSGLQVLRPDETRKLLQTKAQQNNDKPISLPFIALSRDKEIRILETAKQSKTFRGIVLGKTEERSIPLNVIPIAINYQLDIYTKKIEEADEFVREFIFNIVNYPTLTIKIPYNDCDIEHNANISLEDTIIDNSDIQEHLFYDQFVRYSIRFSIDDAYYFSLPVTKNVSIESMELKVHSLQNPQIVESSEIISE